MSQKQSTTQTLIDASPCPSGQQSSAAPVSNKGSVGQLALGPLSWECSKGSLMFHYKTSTDMEVTALAVACLAPQCALAEGVQTQKDLSWLRARWKERSDLLLWTLAQAWSSPDRVTWKFCRNARDRYWYPNSHLSSLTPISVQWWKLPVLQPLEKFWLNLADNSGYT